MRGRGFQMCIRDRGLAAVLAAAGCGDSGGEVTNSPQETSTPAPVSSEPIEPGVSSETPASSETPSVVPSPSAPEPPPVPTEPPMPVATDVDLNDPNWQGLAPKMVFKALQPRNVSAEPPKHLTGGYVLDSFKPVGTNRAKVVYTRPGAYGHLGIELEDVKELPQRGWATVMRNPSLVRNPHQVGVSICYTLPGSGGMGCEAFAEDVRFTIIYYGYEQEQPHEGLEPLLQEFLRQFGNP